MYRIIKALNNNGILVYNTRTKKEQILLGNGIGFGKKPSERLEEVKGAKVYSLVPRESTQSALKVVNGIAPEFIEAAGKLIEIAEEEFQEISHDILLPMADHIALAAKRAREGKQMANPFTPDIRALFKKEYQVALKGRKIMKEMLGYEISDDEVGFLTLHIHSGLSDERVSETLHTTRIINESIAMIEQSLNQTFEADSLAYTRLTSHLYYMIARARNQEKLHADFNEFIFEKYPATGEVSKKICNFMEQELKEKIAQEEIGFLAIHIQRMISPKDE